MTEAKHVLRILITVDTETWPRYPNWRDSQLARELDLDVFGQTQEGEFGISYQMDVLNEYGLKAVFFVEALFATAIGLKPLTSIVEAIQARGHEVQLHVHPEWLDWINPPLIGGKREKNLKDFSEDEQTLLLTQGLQNLQDCGVRNVRAFRAGNYGANLDTLKALARTGIIYDTSYDINYLNSHCGIHLPELLLQPRKIHGVYEFPISFFTDWPGHFRHAQLCACSSWELETILMQAWKEDWYSFVLVSHSFELLKGRNHFGKKAFPDRIVIRRFERFCRFLAKNQDKFQTRGFSELDPQAIPAMDGRKPLSSTIDRTALRYAEQLARKL